MYVHKTYSQPFYLEPHLLIPLSCSTTITSELELNKIHKQHLRIRNMFAVNWKSYGDFYNNHKLYKISMYINFLRFLFYLLFNTLGKSSDDSMLLHSQLSNSRLDMYSQFLELRVTLLIHGWVQILNF